MPADPVLDNWFVVRTQSNREQYAADNVLRSGANYYLPKIAEVVRKVVRGRRIRKEVESPLFPGYIFVKTPEGQWRFLLTTYGVVGLVIGTEGIPGTIAGRDIERLRARESAGRIVLPPKPSELLPNQRIRVGSGMFSGYVGNFMCLSRECSPRERIKILLDYMGRKVPFLLEEDALVEAA